VQSFTTPVPAYKLDVGGTVFSTRWRNAAHQSAFRAGARAFYAGKEESAPYGCGNRSQLDFRRAWLDGFQAAAAFALTARCRSCGCSQHRACPSGCWWSEPELCSACTDTDPRSPRTKQGLS
jgi:hypothetical protein